MKNIMFPGRRKYTGPTTGMFGLLHHDTLCEWSHDVNERVAYVKLAKPKAEVAIRLHNMIYLGDCPAAAKHKLLDDDYRAKHKLLYDDYLAKRKLQDDVSRAERKLLDDDYRPKRKLLDVDILSYIRQHIPDCAWDGKELRFT